MAILKNRMFIFSNAECVEQWKNVILVCLCNVIVNPTIVLSMKSNIV